MMILFFFFWSSAWIIFDRCFSRTWYFYHLDESWEHVWTEGRDRTNSSYWMTNRVDSYVRLNTTSFFIIVECNAWTFYSATLECVELIVISCAVERSGQRNAVLIRSRNRRTKFAIELHSIHLYLFTFVQASWTKLFFIRNCYQNCFFIL